MSIGLCKIIPYAPSTAPRTPRSGVFASSQGRGSAPPAVFALCFGRGRTPPLHCHCEERSDAAIRIPAPAGAELPPPLCKGRWQREALTEGLSKRTFRAPARGTFAPGGLFSVSAPLFAAAFALKCRAVQLWQELFLNGGQRPPPTFAAKWQRRDLIIALPLRRVFPKREGHRPPSLVVSRLGDFQGGREIEIPSPLNGAFGYFCRY